MKNLKKEKQNKIYIDIFDEVKYNFQFDVKILSKRIVKQVLINEKFMQNVSINLSFVSKGKIKKINSKYRHINKQTDVLSFPAIMDLKKNKKQIINPKNIIRFYDYETKTIFLGDIVICTDVMELQAYKFLHSVKREYSFLFLHSFLHLFGYDHMKKNDEKIMFGIQNDILNKLRIVD